MHGCCPCLCRSLRDSLKTESQTMTWPSLRARSPRLPVAAGVPASGRWFARDEAIMGTAIHVELWSDDAALAQRAIDAVMAEMHRIDRLMSPFKDDSELSCINRGAATKPVAVGAELFGLIERSLQFSRLS